MQDSTGLQVRIFDQRVESLTEAGGERGLGVRVWIDGRAGYAYGTDLGDRGIGEIAAGAVEAARVADPDEFAAAPEALGEPERSRASPTRGGPLEDGAQGRACDRDRACRARGRRARRRGRDDGVRRRARRGGARVVARSLRRLRGDLLLRLPLGDRRGGGRSPDRPRLRHGPLPGGARPRGDRPRGGGALDRAARRGEAGLAHLPVVLDETVAASFAGFIGGVLCATRSSAGARRSPGGSGRRSARRRSRSPTTSRARRGSTRGRSTARARPAGARR